MPILSLKQFINRRGDYHNDVLGRALPGAANGSLKYLLKSVTFARNLVNGDVTLPRLIQDVLLAQIEINITIYLFFSDLIGEEFADVLIQKASHPDNPIPVRLILDINKTKLGHLDLQDKTDKLITKMRAGGVLVIDSSIDYDTIIETNNTEYNNTAKAIRETVAIDAAVVDHRKLITIDGTIAYCGSANVGAEYLYHIPFDPTRDSKEEAELAQETNQPEAWEKWHDGLVRFIGPVVRHFNDFFRERWVLDGGMDFPPAQFDPVHLAALDGYAADEIKIVAGQPVGTTNAVRELYVNMINNAVNSIFIENPYLYHPDIVDALIGAKLINPYLRIDLVLPNKSKDDSVLSFDAQQFRYQRYLPVGINVYEYNNHFNHMKLAAFDDRYVIIGSANLNYRSLEHDRDFELVVLIDCPRFAEDINTTVRDIDISRSKNYSLSDIDSRCSPINFRDILTRAAEELRMI